MVIITEGKPFKRMAQTYCSCPECGCNFTYTERDVMKSKSLGKKYVVCPWCGEDVQVEEKK